jgi:2-dehydro-3-deoxyglucarate aldolase/4-hydroxy-2-oxoheptanedioate aldolase
MSTESFGSRLRDEKFSIGTFVTIDAPEVAEIMSGCGYDFLLFDMEHTALSTQATQRLILACHGQCTTLVRVPDKETVWIKKILDTGCDGIVVPLVNCAEEAEQVVRAAKYPPVGARSVGISRAQGYGAGFTDYVTSANEHLTLIIQIEHEQAVANIDNILAVPGIDAVMIGPYDLSGSMKLLGQVDHPDVQSAIALARDACLAAGIPVGIFTMQPEQVPALEAQGFHFVILGMDTATLFGACRQTVAAARGSESDAV